MSDKTTEEFVQEKREEFIEELKAKAYTLEKKISERPYTLRPMNDDDLWPMLAIIAKVFPDELSEAFVNVVSKKKTMQEIGYDVGFKLVVAVIKNIPTIGDDVYDFLSSLSGIPSADIRKMPFGTTPKMIWDIYHEVKNVDFFGAASRSS